MIDYRGNEIIIVNSLQDWLTKKGYNCPVILANQATPVPEYPFISYTVTMPVIANMKGYGLADGGTWYKQLAQTWSFTAQSNDDVVSANVALLAYDWFAIAGVEYLGNNNIAIQRMGDINNRDNLLTIEYEHRNGFDVTFSLLHTLDDETGSIEEVITTANNKIVIDVIKEV